VSIVVEDYHKTYGDTVAVAGLTFYVSPGDILGLVGPNGAGKTTTLRALAGILRPTYGRLLIDGHDIVADPIAAKAALAYVPDDPSLFDRLTVWEHFRFMAAAYGLRGWEPRAEWLLTRLELTEKRHALASELSRGMRQKVAIGCGYLHNPKAVLLDEPLTGLDPRGIRTMKDLIRESAAAGAAVIVSSHLLSLFEDLCTTLLILHRGRLLRFGRLADLRNELAASGRQETLEELFFRLTETWPEPERGSGGAAEQGRKDGAAQDGAVPPLLPRSPAPPLPEEGPPS
jgi:ABC-2 type transport system ATP-binding protein